MKCNHCGDQLASDPVRQESEYFCSLECANLASGIDPKDEENGYFEEHEIEELHRDEE